MKSGENWKISFEELSLRNSQILARRSEVTYAQALLHRRRLYHWDDIAKFGLTHKVEWNITDNYYLIRLTLQNEQNVPLFYTAKNEYAVKLIGFLRDVTKVRY